MKQLTTVRRRGALALALCIASIAAMAFPALASAVTAAPLLGPVSASAENSTEATLKATIYPYGLPTTYYFQIGPTTMYGTFVPVPAEAIGSADYPTAVQGQQVATGLSAGTVYHYRVSATNSMGTVFSNDQTFTTPTTPPTVSTPTATPVAGGYELSGTVNPNGSATSYHFDYGTSTAYGNEAPTPDGSAGSGGAAVPVAETLTGLLPNTTYHFRLVAHGSGTNVTSSSDVTFTTPASGPAKPAAVVNAPQATAGGYLLKGQINPNSVATHYHFEFGPTTAYGTNLPASDENIGGGNSTVDVAKEVTGLQPSTTYHYRIVAVNAEGPTQSLDRTFTTAPPKPTVQSLPVTETAGGFTLNAKVNPNGAATTYHFDFGITAAYGQNIPGKEVSIGSGSGPVSVSQPVTGLPPGVPYHYRVVATNAGGTVVGDDVFFVTPTPSDGGGGSGPQLEVPKIQPPAPAPAPPSNTASSKPTAAKNGALTLKVTVPGPGTIAIAGKKVKAAKATAGAAGVVPVKLTLTTAGKKAMNKAPGKKLAVKLSVVYTPTGGTPGTTQPTVTFR